MNKNLHPIFAQRIQQVMDENGWSMADLSRRVMLSHTSIRKWVSGVSVASGERLKRLSAVTGRPEYWFFMEPDAEGSDSEVRPRVLDEKEDALLALFNQLPEAEKLKVILHTKSVVNHLDSLKDEVSDLINELKK